MNPTVSEQAYHDALCEHIGCIVCLMHLKTMNRHCGIHHIDGRTRPDAHKKVLPLCGPHHQTGGEGVAIHPFKRKWEYKFGTQRHLQGVANGLLRVAGYGHLIP